MWVRLGTVWFSQPRGRVEACHRYGAIVVTRYSLAHVSNSQLLIIRILFEEMDRKLNYSGIDRICGCSFVQTHGPMAR